MRVVVCPVGEMAEIREIGETLKDYQELVGGYIEAVYPYEDLVAIICNEEGKIKHKGINRALKDEEGKIIDVICGDFFICGITDEDFCGLDEELAEKYKEMFDCPETIIKIGDRIMAIPYKPGDIEVEEEPKCD